jgi:hypothetical protein
MKVCVCVYVIVAVCVFACVWCVGIAFLRSKAPTLFPTFDSGDAVTF